MKKLSALRTKIPVILAVCLLISLLSLGQNQKVFAQPAEQGENAQIKFRLFGISRGDAIYGGSRIRKNCDSLQYPGRDVGTKLRFGECHSSVV